MPFIKERLSIFHKHQLSLLSKVNGGGGSGSSESDPSPMHRNRLGTSGGGGQANFGLGTSISSNNNGFVSDDDDLYSGYNDFPSALNTDDLEFDENFQNSARTMESRRPTVC
jgi:hypothetical protein